MTSDYDEPMAFPIPEGARPASRILLIDHADRALYLRAQDTPAGNVRREFWVMPGGGLEPGETFEQAARRELLEETGVSAPLGPCIWTRHHTFLWDGRRHSQFEVFFVARVASVEVVPVEADAYVVGHRWWTLEELRTSREEFAPRNIATLLAPILAGRYPSAPFDCGV